MGLKHFINGMEVSSKNFWDLRKIFQESYGMAHFGKMPNFDYYYVLNDGSLRYVATR